MVLQSDPGTENCIMGSLQCLFRHTSHDTFSGIRSYRVVRSIFNQVHDIQNAIYLMSAV